MLISYILGQKYYYINYDLKKIGIYVGLALLLYVVSLALNIDSKLLKFSVNSIFILVYLAIVVYLEKDKIKTAMKL
jgi:hypothetical protein